MIQTLEDMIRRVCAYGLELKDSDGFTHDWCNLIPAFELAEKRSVHFSTAFSFKIMSDKVKHHAKQSMNDAFDYEKQKCDKSNKVPEFKVGDLVLVSALNFNDIRGQKKLKYSYVGLFVIVALCGNNSVQVESRSELENKHPTSPVSLIRPYQPADKEFFL
ncbi:hypothetical protein O181_076957 [Austropuccinia psidii MF-1]|uniref:Uncharacterized protein n=1 Tax=Austropuccinia psidii MF-1 TaxID=1389203 RepID=A0A9Q3FHU9_9BASI|nr:hypothetical protein [Austropuccinia psidii MF-1]